MNDGSYSGLFRTLVSLEGDYAYCSVFVWYEVTQTLNSQIVVVNPPTP